MYAMEQAERLAAEFLRQLSAGWDNEVTLFEEDECKAKKGDFFYFAFQSVEYVTTREDKYFLYGPCLISVHSVTGECRLLSIQESHAVDPFNHGQGQATRSHEGEVMYTQEQAEQLAANYLRRVSADWDHEVALFEEDSHKAAKGNFFYFGYQSAKYLSTRDRKYLVYGPPCISVHNVTGECRFVSMQDLQEAGDPFNWWQ